MIWQLVSLWKISEHIGMKTFFKSTRECRDGSTDNHGNYIGVGMVVYRKDRA